MKIRFLLLPLLTLATTGMADELLDRCSSSEFWHSVHAQSVLPGIVRDSRRDCVHAMLANGDMNVRGACLEAASKLSPEDQRFVLDVGLESEEAWVEPRMGGELLACYDGVMERYGQMLGALGLDVVVFEGRFPVEPSGLRLASDPESGRAGVLRALRQLKAGNVPAAGGPPGRTSPVATQPPPVSDNRHPSNWWWALAVIVVAVLLGLWRNFRKECG